MNTRIYDDAFMKKTKDDELLWLKKIKDWRLSRGVPVYVPAGHGWKILK